MLVFPGLLGSRDPFPLSFTDDVSFKLGKRSQHLKEELGERILCAVVLEGQSLLLEPHGHALDQQGVDQILEILKATDKSVDGVYPERVTFPQVLQAFLEGGTIGVLAAGLILENLGELLAALRAKLSACVLVCAADSDVSDVSVGHGTVLLACGGRGRVDTRHAPATSLVVQKNCTRNRNSPDYRYAFFAPIPYPIRVYPRGHKLTVSNHCYTFHSILASDSNKKNLCHTSKICQQPNFLEFYSHLPKRGSQ